MSDLQLGLLAIGVLVVAGVVAYNRWQERAARRGAERAFRSAHADVLVEPEAARREPVGGPAPAPSRPAVAPAALPDARIDYVVEIAFPQPVTAASLAALWKPHEHRYARRALLALQAGDGPWVPLGAHPGGGVRALRAGLQLVTRDGALGEADLIEFRGAIESLAGATGARIEAPEMRESVDAARRLERFCADSDIQVVFHVVPAPGSAFAGERVQATAEASGLTPEAGGGFALRDAEGRVLYALGPREGAPEALSVTLDVARTPDTARSFRSMAAFARALAAALGGALVDDAGHALDERAVGAIAAQLETVRGAFEAKGVVPGSTEALRLFS
jgi:hypothetical protein